MNILDVVPKTCRHSCIYNTFLLKEVGSSIHGLSVEGTDDTDYMGICIEPTDVIMGLNNFEHFIYRSAAEREGKDDAPSQPGDTDLVIYGLRKWCRLALKGNPTVQNLLFINSDINTVPGNCELNLPNIFIKQIFDEYRDYFISAKAGYSFLGYMRDQKNKLKKGGGKRQQLIDEYGYDIKYAAHLIRLGLQGLEYLTTKHVSIPVREPHRTNILNIKKGLSSYAEVIKWSERLEMQLTDLLDSKRYLRYNIPESPNYAKINEMLYRIYKYMAVSK